MNRWHLTHSTAELQLESLNFATSQVTVATQFTRVHACVSMERLFLLFLCSTGVAVGSARSGFVRVQVRVMSRSRGCGMLVSNAEAV